MIYLLIFFMITALTISAFWSVERLAIVTTCCMLCSSLLGDNVYVMFGYPANIGGVFFAATLFGIVIIYHLSGEQRVRQIAHHILTALFFVFGATMILGDGNMLPSGLHPIAVQRMLAAFLSFYFGQRLLIWLITRDGGPRPILRYPVALIVTQIFIAALFIPFTYYAVLPWQTIVEYTLFGWLMKTVLILLAVPHLWLILSRCPKTGLEHLFEDER